MAGLVNKTCDSWEFLKKYDIIGETWLEKGIF